MNPTALIAEDEPLLAQALHTELARAWPTLQVRAVVGDGASAVAQALTLRPDVLFLDIRMPVLNGLDAAADLADAWPVGARFPAVVFVTAYDEYAVQAFDAQAVDYLLKPVQAERLARTVQRVQQHLALQAPEAFDQLLQRLRGLLSPPQAEAARLRHITASVGSDVRLVPLDEVQVFEAADKYVRVLTPRQELLIRTPLKELLPRLDGEAFWQIHRGTVVQVAAIDRVRRDASGRLTLTVRGRPDHWAVSRLYAERFRAM